MFNMLIAVLRSFYTGYVVLKDCLSPDEMKALQKEVNKLQEALLSLGNLIPPNYNFEVSVVQPTGGGA